MECFVLFPGSRFCLPRTSFFLCHLCARDMNAYPLPHVPWLSSQLLQQAEEISHGVTTWKKGKTFVDKVAGLELKTDTYTKNFNNDFWAAREATLLFDDTTNHKLYELLDKHILGSLSDLGKTHSEYEKLYVEEVVDYTLVPSSLESTDPNYDAVLYFLQAHYRFGWPLSRRVFYEFVHVLRAKDGSHGYVVTLAVTPDQEGFTRPQGHVVARYTSVEEIRVKEEGIQWIMATASDAGGWVPRAVQKLAIHGAVAKDVPCFFRWALEEAQ